MDRTSFQSLLGLLCLVLSLGAAGRLAAQQPAAAPAPELEFVVTPSRAAEPTPPAPGRISPPTETRAAPSGEKKAPSQTGTAEPGGAKAPRPLSCRPEPEVRKVLTRTYSVKEEYYCLPKWPWGLCGCGHEG